MSELPILIELQSVHDNLRTIQRDLTAYPPDLAALDTELKGLAKKLEDTAKGLATNRTLHSTLSDDLGAAQRVEDAAKVSLRTATQKVQYAAAVRELDERQRQRNAAARPVKEAEARISTLEQVEAECRARQAEAQKQFDELMEIFLSEHTNQVEARTRLEARCQELEATLQPATLTRFQRLMRQRDGRAVVGVDGGACGGCRTRLRVPLLAKLRDDGVILCESCQRILYNPAKS